MRSLRPDELVVDEEYRLHHAGGSDEELASLDHLDASRKLPYGAFSASGEQFDLEYEDGGWHIMGDAAWTVTVSHKDLLVHLHMTEEKENA